MLPAGEGVLRARGANDGSCAPSYAIARRRPHAERDADDPREQHRAVPCLEYGGRNGWIMSGRMRNRTFEPHEDGRGTSQAGDLADRNDDGERGRNGYAPRTFISHRARDPIMRRGYGTTLGMGSV